MRTFTCAHCGVEIDSDWSEEDAKAEFERNYGHLGEVHVTAVVCDACYERIRAARF